MRLLSVLRRLAARVPRRLVGGGLIAAVIGAVAIATLGRPVPVAATAPALLQAAAAGPQRGPILTALASELVAGTYGFAAVEILLDPDESDEPEPLDGDARKALMGNLEAFAIPDRARQQLSTTRVFGPWNTRPNLLLRNGGMFFNSRVNGTDPLRCVPDEAREKMLQPINHVLDINQSPGGWRIRMAAWSDLRWRRKGTVRFPLPGTPVPCLNACIDLDFNPFSDPPPAAWHAAREGCNWLARQPLPGAIAQLRAGTIPVVTWQVNPGDVLFTRQQADNQYLNASFGNQQQGLPTIQTVDLAAVPVLGDEATATVNCPESLDRRQRPLCTQRVVRLHLEGQFLRRTYNDLRVNVRPDSAGGLRVVGRFRTTPRAWGVLHLTANGPPSAWQAQLRRLRSACGVSSGFCGPDFTRTYPLIAGVDTAGKPAVVPLRGVDYVRGGDDSLRAVQLCSAVLRKQGLAMPDSLTRRLNSLGKAEGENELATACVNNNNPMAQQLSDQFQLPQLVDTITPGARTRDTTTRAGRVQTNTGIRIVENPIDTSRNNSEWRRQCQATWRRDSTRTVNTVAPGFVFDLSSAKKRYETCLLQGGEDLPDGWQALTPAGQAWQARRPPRR